MANLNGIKNLLFDFGGVIVGINKQNAIERFRELGILDIENYLGEFRQKGIFLDIEEGKITREEFYIEFRKLTNKIVSDKDIDSGWLAFLTEVAPYKLDLLRELRKQFNIYLLSNTNPIIMEWAHSDQFSERDEILSDFFDKMFLSYQIGYTKPEEESFRTVIKDTGLNPSETLFLDDGQSNLDIAQKLGFKTCLVNQDTDLRDIFK